MIKIIILYEEYNAMNKKGKINSEIDELRKIKISINTIKKNYQDIDSSMEIRGDVKKMIDILDKIYMEIFNNSQHLMEFKFYGDYYLPIIAKIIDRYNYLCSKVITSQNTQKLLNNIEQTIKKLNIHFENKYASFFDDEIIDLDSDIKVLLQELNIK